MINLKLADGSVLELEEGKNCYDAARLISENKLGKPTGDFRYSGYCVYPEYEFDPATLEKFCLNPEELQERPIKNKERNDAR